MRSHRFLSYFSYTANALVLAAVVLLLYGLIWNYSSRLYLKGFADAIVPLEGPPESKSYALLNWIRNGPERNDATINGTARLRDPVKIVQNARLLKYCGSATNAFINLASVAGVRARRLLLFDDSGGTKHVLAEVQSKGQWIVVDPSVGLVFKDHWGQPLTKEDLRDPEVFRDAISRMPGYSPTYTFDQTAHIHLRRIPVLGNLLRGTLSRLFSGWEDAIDWGYFPENPSLWPIFVSSPVLFLGIFLRLVLYRYNRKSRGLAAVVSSARMMSAGHAPLYRSP